MDGLNVAYGETEKRSFLRLNLVALAFTAGAFVGMVLALGAVVVVPVFLSHIGLGGAVSSLIRVLRWPLLLTIVVLGLTVLYRYGPSLKDPQWTWLFPGNVIAAIGWFAASALFSWYIANFGTYDATYGSLGAAMGMMMWMWISAIVVLLGAELNAEIERETKRDPPARKRLETFPVARSFSLADEQPGANFKTVHYAVAGRHSVLNAPLTLLKRARAAT